MNKVEICGIDTSKLKTISEEKKRELLRRSKDGDRAAREELIVGNLRLVLSIVSRFNPHKDTANDLFQVGCIGLIKSIDNFNLDIDVIYISGGNTFGTMKLIRDAGFDKAIINYVQNGVVYIGGSAGAHIATANISRVAKYDVDTYGLTDFLGLGLYNGILICHYDEDRRSDFEELKSLGQHPVTALTDSDSILIKDD